MTLTSLNVIPKLYEDEHNPLPESLIYQGF